MEEQNYYTYNEPVQPENAPETQPVREPPKSPFADSPYINYHNQEPYQQTSKPKKSKKKSNAGEVLLTILLVVIVIVSSCAATVLVMNEVWDEKTELLRESFNSRIDVLENQLKQQDAGSAVTQVPAGDYLTPGQVYAQNVQAVVAVSCYVQEEGYLGSETYESFGSGFIISLDGYVVTNYHVIEGATDVWVTMYDGTEHEATVVGYEANDDVALLKMDGKGFPVAKIGSSDALSVGDQVVAIGNPLGELTSTLTVGYVSAKDRVVTTDGTTQNMFQTDAAINSGNSGGPLFNMYGQVVGITTAKYSGTSTSGASIEGIGFAIPMDDVMGIIDDLREFGYVTGAYLGVYVRDVDAGAQTYGLPAGAYVEEPMEGSAAREAGIQNGDIIIDLGGHKITSVSDLTRALREFEADEATTVTVYRSGKEITLPIVLDPKPVEQENVQEETMMQPGMPGFEDWYKDFFEDYFG